MDTMHRYIVRARSTRLRSGVIASESVPQPLKFSAPPEFQGEPGVWTPEDFFVASVVTCFVSTFSGMSELSKLSFVSLEVEAEGLLERDASGWKFTEIKLRPSLKLAHEKDRDRAARILEKAERTCLIARSISARLTVEASVSVAEEIPIPLAG
jgi:peroxiredoxin-like protein